MNHDNSVLPVSVVHVNWWVQFTLWTFGVSGEFRSLERLGHRLSEYWPFRERRTLFLWYRAIVEGPLWVWRRLCHWERTLKTMIEGEWKNEMKGIEIHRNEIHHISQSSGNDMTNGVFEVAMSFADMIWSHEVWDVSQRLYLFQEFLLKTTFSLCLSVSFWPWTFKPDRTCQYASGKVCMCKIPKS